MTCVKEATLRPDNGRWSSLRGGSSGALSPIFMISTRGVSASNLPCSWASHSSGCATDRADHAARGSGVFKLLRLPSGNRFRHVMGAYGSVVERLGERRGLPAQTMTLNRRRCGLLLNSGQLQFLNGYGCLTDTWPIGPDNGTYRARDGRYVTIIGLDPHLRDGLLEYFQCTNSARAIQAAVEKKTAQQIEDELAALRFPPRHCAQPAGMADPPAREGDGQTAHDPHRAEA